MGRPPGSKNKTTNPMALARLQQQETATALERAKRDASAAALMDDDDDDSDVMFAPGRSDNLCGVVPNYDRFHYCICTENTRTQGRARPNLARLLEQGYEFAKLPNGELADWPEVSKAVMCVPIERWNKYQKSLQKRVAQASGLGLGQTINGMERVAGIDVKRHHSKGSISPAELGISPPEE